MQNINLRTSIFGGYRKKDVINCLERIQDECEELKRQSQEQELARKKEYDELEEKYQQLLSQNTALQQECDEFHENKKLLVQLEIDANVRVKEKMEIADKKAKQIVCKAHADAAALKEQYILKTKDEILEIKKFQEQLDELTSIIGQKNKKVQEQISSLENIIDEDNETPNQLGA